MPQLASLNKLKHMTAKQQILYDSGMEDEAHKQMNIAYQTFMKGKDEGVLAEYDALNTTMTEEQDALVDYADEMAVSLLSVITLPLSPCFAALPVSRFDIWTLLLV